MTDRFREIGQAGKWGGNLVFASEWFYVALGLFFEKFSVYVVDSRVIVNGDVLLVEIDFFDNQGIITRFVSFNFDRGSGQTQLDGSNFEV